MADIIVNETNVARRTIALYLVNDAGVGVNPSLVSGNVKITKYGGSAVNSINLPTPVATGIAGKHYLILDTTEVDTIGEGWVEVVASGVKSYVDTFNVVSLSGIVGSSVATPSLKTQFVSNEDAELVFQPFVNKNTGTQYLGTDTVTLVVRRPDGTLLPSPPVPLFDSGVNLWTTSIPHAEFMLGQWLVMASSNGTGASSQSQVFTWGDYVDDIQETRQAALGKWKIDALTKRLYLYEDDGITVFKMFDLKDSSGNPSVTQIFERDPV